MVKTISFLMKYSDLHYHAKIRIRNKRKPFKYSDLKDRRRRVQIWNHWHPSRKPPLAIPLRMYTWVRLPRLENDPHKGDLSAQPLQETDLRMQEILYTNDFLIQNDQPWIYEKKSDWEKFNEKG